MSEPYKQQVRLATFILGIIATVVSILVPFDIKFVPMYFMGICTGIMLGLTNDVR